MITTYEQAKLNREVSQRDRTSFAGLMAIVMHLFIIFGITFAFPPIKKEARPQIDITLAHRYTENKPEKADFLGQANQEGGGTEQEILAPSVTKNSLIPDTPLNQTEQQFQQESSSQQPQSLNAATAIDSHKQINNLDQFRPDNGEQTELVEQKSQLPQIDSNLDLTLDTRDQLQAKYVKTRHISAAIHEARDTLYLDNWRRQIERVGNLNYPEEANLNSIYGELVLAVQINHDGSLRQVTIHRSSGHQILDDAAIRIVQLAAPYDPLPEAMRENTDVLEILRTWQFIPGDGFSSRAND